MSMFLKKTKQISEEEWPLNWHNFGKNKLNQTNCLMDVSWFLLSEASIVGRYNCVLVPIYADTSAI